MKRIYDFILVLLVTSSTYSAEPRRNPVPRLEAAKPRKELYTNRPAASKTITVAVTGYCNDNCKICCGIYASKAKPQTASGTVPTARRTVACNFLPFKTKITIKGKMYIVEDRLHPRYKDRIDIFFASHKEAKAFGKQTLTVTILTKK